MEKEYTAVIKQDGDWWIGWIEEIPGINCQEVSRDELVKTLKVTLKEALEFNKHDAHRNQRYTGQQNLQRSGG